MPNTTIPGLPPDLRQMPPAIDGPDDPLRAEKVADWLAWGQRVVSYRHLRWAICEGLVKGYNPERERERELALCEASSIYAITMYMHIYETDPDRLKLYPWYRPEHGGWLPAIPFWYLTEMMHWLDNRLAGVNGLSNGIITKARRMGATDWVINWALVKWLFTSPFSAKFVSRKEDLVYDKNNMDALLQRAIAKLEDTPGNAPIPGWMMPLGWSSERNVSELKVSRPDNKNLLGGEATTGTAGRGGRATVAFIDEAALIGKMLPRITGAVQATAPHVIMLSSETTEEGMEFIDAKDKAKALNPESVLEIDWWQHPFQDREWLDAEEQRYIEHDNHMAFYREVLRQPFAGETGWMYADARNREVESNLIEPWEHEHGHIEIGIDPGFRDETAIHWILVDPICGMDVVLESYEASGFPAEYYAAIIAGANPDDHPEFYFSQSVADLMAWCRELNERGFRPRRLCGDPAGTQSHGGPMLHRRASDKQISIKPGRDDDWYSRMTGFWHDHQLPAIPIVVNWDMKSGRELQARRMALMDWLRATNSAGEPRLRFNPTPQAERTLKALRMSKWPESERRMTEVKDAIHDEHSHRRSAMEFLAVNRAEARATGGGRIASTAVRRQTFDTFVTRISA